MPHNPDEDLSAPVSLPPSRAARDRVAAPQPATPMIPADDPPGLHWGSAGVFHEVGELIASPGRSGVIRYVSNGVFYTAPPVVPAWVEVLREPGRYEMAWEGNPKTARFVADLRSDLARAGRVTNRSHPILAQLDETAIGLATLAERLHDAGWTLGLIQPDNLLIVAHSSGPRTVLPIDLGFAWKGAFGSPPWSDSPGRPDWLNEHPQYDWLRTHEPCRQQFASPDNGVYPGGDPAADIRILGKLIAWLITGKTDGTIPGTGRETPAQLAIEDAVAGKIATAAKLAERLRSAPPSEIVMPVVQAAAAEAPQGKRGELVVAATRAGRCGRCGGGVVRVGTGK